MNMEQEQFFETFYRENFQRLTICAFGYVGDWHIAQDVVQDAFHILLREEKEREFLASPNRMGWMRETVKNVARNAVRSRRRQARWVMSIEELDMELAAADVPDTEDEEAVLKRYAEFLSPQEIYLLRRLALDGATYTELKDELGISMWACYKRVERLEDNLAKTVSRYRLLKKEKEEKVKSRN